MPIFELEKNDLLNLTDGQLEELVARLSSTETRNRVSNKLSLPGHERSLKDSHGAVEQELDAGAR